MSFSGLDPTGGAGIQADIETCMALGVHCAPVITTLTAQDTRNAVDAQPVDPAMIIAQTRMVLQDMPVGAFKIGLITHSEIAHALHTIFNDYPHIPVIVDPVLKAGGGHSFVENHMISSFREFLLPHTHILLPNTHEARQLAPAADTLEACANELIDQGCEHVLMTGTHANTPGIEHLLFTHHKQLEKFRCERLPGEYHGSGCTLAAAVACYRVHGLSVTPACRAAIAFTVRTLQHAQRLGMGQFIPNRAVLHKMSHT
jgi:hydroxymethylpyrimidine/phosphomethylpyrimidine kinase